MAWQDLFSDLLPLLDGEGFDTEEASELSGDVWIRKEARALAKWAQHFNADIGAKLIYFVFTVPPIENYLYEPVMAIKPLDDREFIFKTTNPSIGDGFKIHLGLNGDFTTTPVHISAGQTFLHLTEPEVLPYLPSVDEFDFVSVKFEFDSGLTSIGSNHHIILR